MIAMESKQVEWLTVKEIASELREKETAVREWIRAKKLPAYRFGRKLKVRRSDLEKFIEDSRTNK